MSFDPASEQPPETQLPDNELRSPRRRYSTRQDRNWPVEWPQEHLTEAIRLWAEGKSSREVGVALGKMFGVPRTRNAVLGKMHRVGAKRLNPMPQRRNTLVAMSKSNFIRAPRRNADTDRSRAGTESAIAAAIVRRVIKRSMGQVPPTPIPVNVEPMGLVHSLVGLTDHTCKWPIGDPLVAGFSFCGQEPQPGKSYCPAHQRRAYTAPAPITASRQKSIYPAMRSQHA